MQFCSHLLCHFNLSDNLELSALENVEIRDYSHSFFPSLSMTKQKMIMVLCTPFLHQPLISLGTTLTCLTLEGVGPSLLVGHVDFQVLPSHPRQHWGWTSPSTHGDTQQHSHVPGFPLPQAELHLAPGGHSNISPGCVSQRHAHPHVSASVPSCSSLAFGQHQDREGHGQRNSVVTLSCLITIQNQGICGKFLFCVTCSCQLY